MSFEEVAGFIKNSWAQIFGVVSVVVGFVSGFTAVKIKFSRMNKAIFDEKGNVQLISKSDCSDCHSKLIIALDKIDNNVKGVHERLDKVLLNRK